MIPYLRQKDMSKNDDILVAVLLSLVLFLLLALFILLRLSEETIDELELPLYFLRLEICLE